MTSETGPDPHHVLALLERADPAAKDLLRGAFPAGAATPEPTTPGERLCLRLWLLIGGDRSTMWTAVSPAADSGAATPADDVGRAIVALDHAIAASQAVRSGRVAELVEHTRAASALAPRSMPWIRFYIASLWQSCFRFTGNLALMAEALDACARLADLVTVPHIAVGARGLMGSVHLLRGAYHATLDRCDAAIALAAATGLADHSVVALAHQFRGYVLFEWNRLEAAEAALERAWALSGENGRGVRSGVARIMARLAAIAGRPDDADAWLERLERIVGEPMTLRNREWLMAVRLRQKVGTGDLRALEEWLRAYDYSPRTLQAADDALLASRLHELDHVLTLLEATEQWAVIREVAPLIVRVSESGRAWFAARALAAEAVALEVLGSTGEADACWARALEAGAIGSFVRVYIEGSVLRRGLLERAAAGGGRAGAEAMRVIDASGVPGDGAPAGADVLTPKQLDVLGLVERGASNKAIARELGISITTVKTHLRDAFERLGASSRTEAVARARDLGCF